MANIFDNPSDNVYDAYGKAVAAGQLYNDTLRRNTAFNALSKAYGPEVGDIKLATDAEALKQSQTMDPLLQQQQTLQNAGVQLDNTGKTQTNAFNAQNNPLIIQGNETANATNANTLQQSQKVQQIQTMHSALSGAITSLGTSLNGVDDPNQRLQIFDQQIDQLAPQLGVDATALKHELAQARADVATKGAQALPELQQQVDSLAASNLSPEDQAKLGIAQANQQKAQAQADAAVTKAKNGTTGLTPAQLQKKADQQRADATSLQSYSDAVDDLTAPQTGAIDKAIAFIQAHPDSYGMPAKGIMGHGLADVAGSNAANLAQLLAPITSNVMLQKLSDLKKTSATGASGLGQLSDREGDVLRTSSGSIDQGQSGNQLISGLMHLRDVMLRGRGRLTQSYKMAYGALPTDAPADTTVAAPAPGAAAAPAAGTTPAAPAANGVPAGVDPQLWTFLTPDEQKQFTALGGQ